MNELQNFGFVPDDILTADYIFAGKTKLKGAPLTDGHWASYSPLPEFQKQNDIETYACTIFGTETALQFLWKRLYGDTKNWSERYNAILMGLKGTEGGSPQTAVETMRKKGLIRDSLLPFDDSIMTYDEFYSPDPMLQAYIDEGQNFLDEYKIGHEWVYGDSPETIKEALKYSPLGVSVVAWFERNGFYYFPKGVPPNHWVCLYDYVDGEYWLVFDSYLKEIKKVEWDAKFQQIKRYQIGPNTDINIIRQLVQKLAQLVSLFAFLVNRNAKKPVVPIDEEIPPPAKPVEPAPPSPLVASTLLDKFAHAIQEYEGWYAGSRSFRNLNPGNLKRTAYTISLGAIGRDNDNFCIFPSYETGFSALCAFIKDASLDKLAKYHNCSIRSFCESYAPVADDNLPFLYAQFVAAKIGKLPDAKLKDFI